MMTARREFDYVIIGAGSAGCVLAARLSQDPGVRVALVEAGGRDDAPEIAMPVAFPQLFKTQFDWDFATEPEQGLGWRTLFTAPRQFKASYKATSSPMHAHDHAAVRVRADNSALLAHDFSAAVAKCVVVTNRSLEVTMLKSDPQLMRYPPACRSVKFATRTQHWAFRLRYAAGVAMAFVLSSLAPAMLIALIWHETGLAAMMFAFTFLIALSHAILLGLPLFLICQFRGWVSLASCVALGAFIGIVPAAILAHPAQLSEFSARAWASGVLTASDGAITTAAVWVGYIRSVIYFALFGASGGFIFWTVLKCWGMFNGGRQNLSGNS